MWPDDGIKSSSILSKVAQKVATTDFFEVDYIFVRKIVIKKFQELLNLVTMVHSTHDNPTWAGSRWLVQKEVFPPLEAQLNPWMLTVKACSDLRKHSKLENSLTACILRMR